MTRNETAVVMAAIEAAYPAYYRGVTDESLKTALSLWHELLVEFDSGIVAAAVKSFMASDSKGYPPVIGQIRDIISTITTPAPMTELEAWEHVRKAISKSWRYKDAKKAHEQLPAIIQELVTPGQLCDWARASDSSQEVIASNFMRSYRAKAERANAIDAIPASVKTALAGRGLFELPEGVMK